MSSCKRSTTSASAVYLAPGWRAEARSHSAEPVIGSMKLWAKSLVDKKSFICDLWQEQWAKEKEC